jgi:hypothetical protein
MRVPIESEEQISHFWTPDDVPEGKIFETRDLVIS